MQMKEEYNDIDGLITSYLSGNLDKASFSELQKWTMESEANRIYVRNKLELWFSSGVSGSVEPFDEDAAFTLFQQRAAIFPKKEKPARRSSFCHLLSGKTYCKTELFGYSGGSFIGYTYKIKFA